MMAAVHFTVSITATELSNGVAATSILSGCNIKTVMWIYHECVMIYYNLFHQLMFVVRLSLIITNLPTKFDDCRPEAFII